MTRGFSTLEIVVALAIGALTSVAIVLAIFGTPMILARASEHEEALDQASSLLEETFYVGVQDFDSLLPIASSTSDGYERALQVDTIGDGTEKRLTSRVAWTSTDGMRRTESLSAIIADPNPADDACDPFLSSDWTAPVRNDIKIDPSSWPDATFSVGRYIPSSVTAGGTVLALGMSGTANAGDPTLFLFDTSDPQHPKLHGAIDNAPTTKEGLAALALSGKRLYAANLHVANFSSCTEKASCAQLQIFDLSDPESIPSPTSFKLATATPPYATGSGGQAIGKSIAYRHDRIYLGLSKTASLQGDEFNIIDVKDAAHPIWLGGYHIGRTVAGITIIGTTAYLATDDPAADVVALDVSDPSKIVRIGSFDAPASGIGGTTNAVRQVGSLLYMLRDYAGADDELIALDPGLLREGSPIVASRDLSYGLAPASGYGLVARIGSSMILTKQDLQIWDTSSPAAPAFSRSLPLPAGASGIALSCGGDTVYVASANAESGYLSAFSGS